MSVAADGVRREAGLRLPARRPVRPSVLVRRTYLCGACGWISTRSAAEVEAHIDARHAPKA